MTHKNCAWCAVGSNWTDLYYTLSKHGVLNIDATPYYCKSCMAGALCITCGQPVVHNETRVIEYTKGQGWRCCTCIVRGMMAIFGLSRQPMEAE